MILYNKAYELKKIFLEYEVENYEEIADQLLANLMNFTNDF